MKEGIEIQWAGAGWYKTQMIDKPIRLVKVDVSFRSCRRRAQMKAGVNVPVNFYYNVPAYMTVIDKAENGA